MCNQLHVCFQQTVRLCRSLPVIFKNLQSYLHLQHEQKASLTYKTGEYQNWYLFFLFLFFIMLFSYLYFSCKTFISRQLNIDNSYNNIFSTNEFHSLASKNPDAEIHITQLNFLQEPLSEPNSFRLDLIVIMYLFPAMPLNKMVFTFNVLCVVPVVQEDTCRYGQRLEMTHMKRETPLGIEI